MFMGEFQHNIDAKGRLIVPSKLREQLGEKFVVTRGMDGCLFGYTLPEWNQLETKLNEMPLSKKDARAFVRFFTPQQLSVRLISKDGLISPCLYVIMPHLRKNA